MSQERYHHLMNSKDKLTAEEIAQGWHFCWEWDGLLYGPDMSQKCGCPIGDRFETGPITK